MITIEEVSTVVEITMSRFETKFDEKLVALEERLDKKLDQKFTERLAPIVFAIENLTETTNDIQRRIVHLEHQVADIQETLTDFGDAESKDGLATISHERRISA